MDRRAALHLCCRSILPALPRLLQPSQTYSIEHLHGNQLYVLAPCLPASGEPEPHPPRRMACHELLAGCLCVNALFLARQTLMETVGSGREAAAVWCTSPRTARRCFAMRMDPRAPTVATRPAAAPMVRGGEPA